MRSLFRWLVVMLFVGLFAQAPALGAGVQFDVPQTAAVRDVTSREFAFVHPHERLIELRLSISALVDRRAAGEVREIVQQIESTQAVAQVVDFWPKTQLATTVVGATNIERHKQHDARVGFDVGGGYLGIAKGAANGDFQWQGQENATLTELPPLDVLTASGTVERGRGVYYKLKTSPRTTLEGAYDYVLVLRVPRLWRAGLVQVASEAVGKNAAVLGRQRFLVALYQQGDAAAQAAAQRYAAAEGLLRRVAAAQRGEIERKMYPTIVHKLGVTRDGALAKDWFEATVFRGAGEEVLHRLPQEVRGAAEGLAVARRELAAVNIP